MKSDLLTHLKHVKHSPFHTTPSDSGIAPKSLLSPQMELFFNSIPDQSTDSEGNQQTSPPPLG